MPLYDSGMLSHVNSTSVSISLDMDPLDGVNTLATIAPS